LTPADQARLDTIFAGARTKHVPRVDPNLMACAVCDRPCRMYDGKTCSTSIRHNDGTRTAVAWHLGCVPS
jgi:hypothetical protein